MGLDMYLIATKHLSGGWDHATDKKKTPHRLVCEAINITNNSLYESSGSMEVSWTAAYWRSENAIHNWFVENCQNGVDECQRSYVSIEQLKQLLDICKEIINAPVMSRDSVACEMLPTSTDIDESYYKGLHYTIKQLDKIITNPELDGCDFYYTASW